jgi:DNA-binding Lrp family transcriptional regulator
MGTHTLDEIERGLLQALQVDGRVPFLAVGEVLGVSDQTVARRYARLRSVEGVRVSGTIWPDAVGEQLWLVRVQCAPEAAAGLARALARQDETSWVRVASGGAEIVCMARMAADASAGEHTVLSRLPRTPRVTGVSAHCVLNVFFGGRESLLNKSHPLTAEQLDRLRPPRPRPTGDPVELTPGDHQLLRALGQDGRAGYRHLASVTGWSQTTVRRRLGELRHSGVVYFDVDFEHALLGLRSAAALWLSVEPGQLAAAGEALARHPQVGFAAATTGAANLYAGVLCANSRALYEYLTGPIAALPGLRSVETAPIMRIFKKNAPAVE